MKEYMEILIWTMLLVVVIEMVFPTSPLQKYIKLILGFILTYTMLSPIIKGGLFEQGKYDTYVQHYQDQFNLTTDKGKHIEDYELEVIDAFIEHEKQKITSALEKDFDIKVVDVEVGVELDVYMPATTDISLTVRKLAEGEESGIAKIVIPKIKIGEKDENIILDDDDLKKEIKSCLSDFYNWDKVNIYIIVQGD